MLLRSAVYDRLLAVSPCYRVKVPISTRSTLQVLTPEQVHRLLEAAWDCDRAVLATAVGTGLRQGETLGLRLAHVNLLRRELAVEEQALTPPTGSPYITRDLKTAASRRVVPLPQFVVAAVARHLQVYGAGPAGELFLNRRYKVRRRAASTTPSGSRRCAGPDCRRGTASMRCGTRTPPDSSPRTSTRESSRPGSGSITRR
jgi:integrase